MRFTDDNIGLIVAWLKEQGLYGDDLAIIITADHGEDLGEFGVYGEHGMADEPVCHIPLIIRWPGAEGGRRIKGFYDNTDLLPYGEGAFRHGDLLGTTGTTASPSRNRCWAEKKSAGDPRRC